MFILGEKYQIRIIGAQISPQEILEKKEFVHNAKKVETGEKSLPLMMKPKAFFSQATNTSSLPDTQSHHFRDIFQDYTGPE